MLTSCRVFGVRIKCRWISSITEKRLIETENISCNVSWILWGFNVACPKKVQNKLIDDVRYWHWLSKAQKLPPSQRWLGDFDENWLPWCKDSKTGFSFLQYCKTDFGNKPGNVQLAIFLVIGLNSCLSKYLEGNVFHCCFKSTLNSCLCHSKLRAFCCLVKQVSVRLFWSADELTSVHTYPNTQDQGEKEPAELNKADVKTLGEVCLFIISLS